MDALSALCLNLAQPRLLHASGRRAKQVHSGTTTLYRTQSAHFGLEPVSALSGTRASLKVCPSPQIERQEMKIQSTKAHRSQKRSRRAHHDLGGASKFPLPFGEAPMSNLPDDPGTCYDQETSQTSSTEWPTNAYLGSATVPIQIRTCRPIQG